MHYKELFYLFTCAFFIITLLCEIFQSELNTGECRNIQINVFELKDATDMHSIDSYI